MAYIAQHARPARCLSLLPFDQIAISFLLRPCLVHLENQNVFKISRHIKSFDTCIKH